MPRRTERAQNLGQNGQNLVRIVIASYFLAISVGLIPGTTALPLTEPFLPEAHAAAAGKAVVFAAAYLVLLGLWLRFSALLLATLLFWSSYIQNVGAGNLEGFWRDLALIGALILTYTQTLPRAERGRAALRWTRRARRLTPAQRVTPRRPVSAAAAARHAASLAETPLPSRPAEAQPRLRVVASTAEPVAGDNIFREDPDLALAS